MKFEVLQCQQRSGDWFAARLGRLTGSRAIDMLAKLKSGAPAKARQDLLDDLVCERLTGVNADADQFVSRAMQRGIELEATALAEYEIATGEVVNTSGFLQAVELQVGASLDGHIDGFKGIVELKVPGSVTHLNYLRGDVIPKEYLPQLTHNLWVSGAQWVDFVSFDDRFPKSLQLFCRRLHAKDAGLPAYEAEALTFLAELELAERAIREKVAA